MPNGYTYFDTLNMARAINGLGPVGAGVASGVTDNFGTTVIGGTALCVGLPLALKGAKGLVWDAPQWAYQNRGNYGEGFGSLYSNFKKGVAERRALTESLRGRNWFESVGNRVSYDKLNTQLQQIGSKIPQKFTGFDGNYYRELLAKNPEQAEKYLKEARTASKAARTQRACYTEANKKLKEISNLIKNKKFKEAKQAFNELGNLVKQGDAKLAEGIKAGTISPKAGSTLAKIGSNLKKFTGIDTLSKGINETIAKGAVEGATKGAKVAAGSCKAVKSFVKGGGALTALIEFGVDTYENWEIYKSGTTSQKLKQAGKSAAVAAGAGIGWWAGHAAGAALGGVASAAIAGSAIGSVVPGLGTVVGAVIGIGCGLIGSWLGSKAAKAAVGPSELEKQRKADATKQAREAQSDETKMKELLDAYQLMLNGREEMISEGIDEQATCPQDNTYVAKEPVLDINM